MTEATPIEPGKDLTLPDEPLETIEESPSALSRVGSFTASCAINLVLPFINGLMLGFGELLAHEVCWRKSIFPPTNRGYQIYPERRKFL
ncbi:hypothetical protein ZYGR_0Z01680 [Zygosaccharomyces rouxii]|uniref:ZYRO0G04158p n=2 Tax=Zygosaccharomyces rouxii TaxID=4956 RepID=C5DZG2_ZYGRC|nr:uncharacterized protein ZYRO0G04158g [Zygosaccharomyces rouxii]GAV50745.1 hypothetical protein ZYGR_0Z01680 [Zygosaccharomyces rouxii]CAR29246.1 ZYRO0G04158p [Zygosaccharomyces rouxii]